MSEKDPKRYRLIESISIENSCKVSGYYAGTFRTRQLCPAPPHSHADEYQLVFPTNGFFKIVTCQGNWLVPGGSGVWIPPGMTHEILWTGSCEILSLYVRKDLVAQSHHECFVFPLTPLMKELLMKFCACYETSEVSKLHNLFQVILDEIFSTEKEPFFLPWAKDKRLEKLLDIIAKNPGEIQPLARLARRSGASQRTLLRLAQKELQMSLQQWKDTWKFIRAIEMLQQGHTVGDVAECLGFENASGLRKLFKRLSGQNPASFV